MFHRTAVAALIVGGVIAPATCEPLNTLKDIEHAFNACWIPPPPEQAIEGMEITVRFSLTRDGNILGEPRFTFVTPSVAPSVREAYQRAVAETLVRCTPLSFTPELGGAVAGRPFSWRLIDNRKQRKA